MMIALACVVSFVLGFAFHRIAFGIVWARRIQEMTERSKQAIEKTEGLNRRLNEMICEAREKLEATR